MHVSQLLLIGASFVASTTAIAFTTLPATVQAGVPFELKWDGSDPSEPVTITLQQGPPDNLITVEVITGKATGKSFTWTPSKSLPNADNYALMISQGQSKDDINYTGIFSLTGGSAAVATTSTSSFSSSSFSSSASQITPAILSSSVASLNNTVSSLVASISNATAVATTTVPAGTAIIGTIGRGGSLSAATGTVMSRNTTMSSATLTRSKTTSTTASTTSTDTASTTAESPAATTSSSSSDAMGLASPLAFVLFAAGAIVYLG